MTKEQREELKKKIDVYSWALVRNYDTDSTMKGKFTVKELDSELNKLLDFIESEVEKAKKEGRELERKEITEEGERLQNQIDKLLREARENVCRERRIGLVN